MSHQEESEMEMPRLQKVKVFAESETSVVVSSNKSFLENLFSSWISFRYLVVRALTCPVPCLPMKISFIGGKSFIEIVALIVTFGITIKFSLKTSSSAGYVADYLGGVLVLCGMRNNVLTVLFGVSFERALYFHKFVALAMVAAMTIHGIGEGLNDTGLALIILICTTVLIYVAKITNLSFELFYYIHVLCYLAIIPVAFLHSATFFPIAGAVWACDLLLRYLITLKKVTAEATVLPGNVVKIQFPKMFAYQPGILLYILFVVYHCAHVFALSLCVVINKLCVWLFTSYVCTSNTMLVLTIDIFFLTYRLLHIDTYFTPIPWCYFACLMLLLLTGQYCFLMVKSLSQVEYHPISISSSPLQDSTTFHIRALGDWTNNLQASVLKRIEEQKLPASGIVCGICCL